MLSKDFFYVPQEVHGVRAWPELAWDRGRIKDGREPIRFCTSYPNHKNANDGDASRRADVSHHQTILCIPSRWRCGSHNRTCARQDARQVIKNFCRNDKSWQAHPTGLPNHGSQGDSPSSRAGISRPRHFQCASPHHSSLSGKSPPRYSSPHRATLSWSRMMTPLAHGTG